MFDEVRKKKKEERMEARQIMQNLETKDRDNKKKGF